MSENIIKQTIWNMFSYTWCVCKKLGGGAIVGSGAIGKRYKLFLMGNEAKTDGVGIFVAEKWADSVVRVERHSERILVLKMVLGDRLLNVFSVGCAFVDRICVIL